MYNRSGNRKRQSSVFSNTTTSDQRRVKFRSEPDSIPEPVRPVNVTSYELDEEEDKDEGGPRPKRILAIHAPYEGNLAAAFYDPDERKIQVLEDTKDTLAWDLAVLVMEQVQPDLIVMSSKTHHTLLDKVEIYRNAYKCEAVSLAHSVCGWSVVTRHLSTVILPNHQQAVFHEAQQQAHYDEEDRSSVTQNTEHMVLLRQERGAGMGKIRLNLVKLGCWVNVDAPFAVTAAGILVNQAKQSQLHAVTPTSQWKDGLEVMSIESMQLDRHMLINKDALTSLAIFDTEAHAFIHAGRSKAAASIFGLLDTTETPLGKKLLHSWHLRPLLNLAEINARHDVVELFTSPDNVTLLDQLKKTLKKVKNIPKILTKLRVGRSGWRDWKNLYEVAVIDRWTAACQTIMELSYSLVVDKYLPFVAKLQRLVDEEVQTFSQDIGIVVSNIKQQLNEDSQSKFDMEIDWDASLEDNRVAVRPMIDEELDQWRNEYNATDMILESIATRASCQVPEGISNQVNAIYFPQLGYHLVVEADVVAPPVIPGWEHMFHSVDKFYYKNAEMHQLDEHFGDLYTMLTNREIEITEKLSGQLRLVEQHILAICDTIAELDCLLALAKAALVHELQRPLMLEEPVLKIFNGSHLLQEIWATPYIKNDALLQGGPVISGLMSMMIVTGANGSGKSIYGKQIALIVFMAQIGSFVPAEQAEIGICDKSTGHRNEHRLTSTVVFTRLQTRESVSKNASAFMIDLAQVSQALRGATERSLLILDEFGKGTTPSDGAGLLGGVIKHLLEGPCPRTVILTHFHELFTHQFLDPDLPILQCHMESIMMEDTLDMRYLYRVRPGPCTTSYAAECALQHGIPKPIVDRARHITRCISNFELDKLFDETLTERNKREIKAAEELAKRFMTWEIDEETTDVVQELRNMLNDVDRQFGLDTKTTSFANEATSEGLIPRG